MIDCQVKAITYTTYGPPEVLQLSEVETPVPGENELLIRTHAAEATKADCEMRSFNFSVKWFWLPLRLALGVFRPKREILGSYFAGEVVEAGARVTRFSVGDEIYGSAQLRLGAYGEYVALPESYPLAGKPSNMSFIEAAAVPLGGLNALHFMRRARIQPGETVLIIGAGGVIGGHAVQIAKAMGAHVTAVDAGHKNEVVVNWGADEFINFEAEDFSDREVSYDVIFDMVPSSSYRTCIGLLKPGGRYLCGNPRLSVMLRTFWTNWLSDKSATFAFAKEDEAGLLELKAMIEAGQITSIVDRSFPMSQARDAHWLVETEQRRGAIVIDIEQSEGES